MTTIVKGEDREVVLTPEEETSWEEFVTKRREDVRAEMFRALFDDVRPAWEESFADGQPVESKTTHKVEPMSENPMYGMYRALFDDVRPAWEEYLARKPIQQASEAGR